MLRCSKLRQAVIASRLGKNTDKLFSARRFSDKGNDEDEDGKKEDNTLESHPLTCMCAYCCPGCSLSTYDKRKYGHCLPNNTGCIDFPPPAGMPKGIFRDTFGEKLGPNGAASKCGPYCNPEYFAFHHMSFFDLHLYLSKYRNPAPRTGRKPI